MSMRWKDFVVIQCLIILLIVGGFYIHKNHVIALKEPPESIALWYKPLNERQVWLHTMFKLRREMLAVEIYAAEKDEENLQKWAEKLTKDYLEIGKMVPEWQKKLNTVAIKDLQDAVLEKRFNDVKNITVGLRENCHSCHDDFRVVTATMYRAPDFSGMNIDKSVNNSTSLESHMLNMSEQVNRIKIAFVDDKQQQALASLSELTSSINSLGGICINCHKQNSPVYPNEQIKQSLQSLEVSLQSGSLQDKGRNLGTLAVLACAQCHGTHRLAYASRKLFIEKKSWLELLKHSF